MFVIQEKKLHAIKIFILQFKKFINLIVSLFSSISNIIAPRLAEEIQEF